MEPAGTAHGVGAGKSSWSWPDRWLALRDRLIASRSFQRRAASFLFTRRVARKRASDLFDLVAGFVYSQVLLACVRLDLFEILAEGPQTLPALASRLSLDADATERLIHAAVSLRLVEHRSRGRFGLGALGAPMVGNRAIAAMVEHHAVLYADLDDPVALLRAGSTDTALARYWPYAAAADPSDLSTDKVDTYSTLMAASQPLIADEILDAYPLARHRCLLDVGGGDGTFLVAAAARAPRLKLVLFDLPAVADRARANFSRRGLADRATAFGGDFVADALPQGADVVSLIRVAFDHDDAKVLSILRAVRGALPGGGTLLLAEPMSGVPGAEAMGDAYFGFYLLAMGRGRPRTVARLTALLEAAGFGEVRTVRTRLPLQTGLLVARAVAHA